MLGLPFRVFGPLGQEAGVNSPPVLSWNSLPLQSCPPGRYRTHWLCGPISPFWSSRGPMVFPAGRERALFKHPNRRSREALRFLQSLSRSHLVGSPAFAAADSSHGLPLPSALARPEEPLYAGLPHPLRSAFRVWLPSWRFAPPGACPALFHAGSAPGICPFEAFSFREVSRMFPSAMNPPVVEPNGTPADESPGDPISLRLLGFDPLGSPSPPPACLAPAWAGCSLGVSPLPGLSPNAWPAVPRKLLPRTWFQHRLTPRGACAPEYRSASGSPAARPGEPGGNEQPS
jgi:hypothetical protein